MALASGEARKDLSADALFGSLRSRFAWVNLPESMTCGPARLKSPWPMP